MDINVQQLEVGTDVRLNDVMKGGQYRLNCPTGITLDSTISEYGAVVSSKKDMISNNDFVWLDDEVRNCSLCLLSCVYTHC